MKRLGLLVGSFDPLHKGHISIAEDAMRFYRLDSVYFAPLPQNENNSVVLSLQNRQKLLSSYLKPPFYILDSQEIYKKTGNCYVDALNRLQAQNPDSALFLLLGMDTLSLIQNFAPILQIPAVKALIVYPRVGYNSKKVLQLAQERGAHSMFFRSIKNLPSSQIIRNQLKELNDVPEWVPASVIHQIAREGFYLPDYTATLKGTLSHSRLMHTLSVRETAVDLAFNYNAPMLKTSVAAMLHDSAKCMPFAQMQKIARENHLTEDGEMLSSPALLHGIVGAHIAKTVYGIQDKDILNAITYHTVGRAGMTYTELCVFLADSIEPLREEYPGLAQLRNLAKQDLKAAALACLRLTKKHILERGGKYSIKAQDTMDDLVRQLS
ncbi:MAG: bis(5'-nucleosyl)-tetraphosphatase (symmetrical) YqeK [Eubacteriales bacterium]|nr:bis(5'-nucleosyl)-tetraphosphatase (symmetrical) YqeK [Eubacteriales bacterium]